MGTHRQRRRRTHVSYGRQTTRRSVTAATKGHATTHFKADKPIPCRPDKPSDKPDMTDKNKAKRKDNTGGRLPFTDKAHKKTEADKEKGWGSPPRQFLHTKFKVHASSRATKPASMEIYRRERVSLEVDPGGRDVYLTKPSTSTTVQPERISNRRYPRITHLRPCRTRASLLRQWNASCAWGPATCGHYVSPSPT
jgi:hypothetical protein